MKMKIFARLISLILIVSLAVTAFAVPTAFTDIPSDHWAKSYIDTASDKGWVNGTGDDVFDPNGNMTRAMLVAVLHRVDGSKTSDAVLPFTDVPTDTWYTAPVLWAYENEIVKGTSDTTFSPESSVTREQIAAILYRYATKDGHGINVDIDLSAYTDAADISPYAKDAMSWAVGFGIIRGRTADTLAPQSTATRAEVTTMICRFVDMPHQKSEADVKLVGIVDWTEVNQLPTAWALEEFYRDSDYTYYFPSIKSEYIECQFSNGDKMTFMEAFESGKADISDLDTYNVFYWMVDKDGNYINSRTDDMPDTEIITGDGEQKGTGEASECCLFWWKNKLEMTGTLKYAIENNPGCIYAVLASYRPVTSYITSFTYEGKTLSELAIEADNERILPEKMNTLLKLGDDLKYGAALYETGNPDGIKWDKKLYEQVTAYIGEELLNKYIVDGVFLREELEKDIATLPSMNVTSPSGSATESYNSDDTARKKYAEAYNAYLETVLPSAMNRLSENGIQCERYAYGNNGLKLLVTEEQLENLPLGDLEYWSFDLWSDNRKGATDDQGVPITYPAAVN